jgi:small subunit ribosomal protein S1
VINELYRKGSLVEALVLNIDKGQKKFSLSVKRLKEDPWKGIPARYHTGDVVEGYITSITDFGVFVEIEEGIEGLIHLSEIEDVQEKNLSEVFKIDDPIQVVILNITERDKRIGLSIKALKKKDDDKVVEQTSSRDDAAFSTLGDFLEPAMQRDNEDKAT